MIHYTAMDDCAAAERVLCSPDLEVSAHYLISEAGEVIQLVDESQRAWHAGASRWGEVTDVNSRSIGIELSNTGFAPFSAPLMNALEHLLSAIMQRHSIPPERVIAHSDCAPGRKIDPGPRFDWQRLARHGLAVWPQPSACDAPQDLGEATDAALKIFGYQADTTAQTRLEAFRLRFRPRAVGAASLEDYRIARSLADRFPVDRKSITA